MSSQTHSTSLPPPPPTSRGFQRVRGHLDHYRSTPNPVLMRELRQAGRIRWTPFVLMALTGMIALLLAAVGGFAGAGASPTAPAKIGAYLHHTFFSIAFFVVTLGGPAVAANSIASEREGRTWEALLLTGLSPGVIARGKFASAYTTIGLYIAMIAPVASLSFLFGGVTATEVVFAFLWLFLLAGVSVAFGLAISSKMQSSRAAILVTLLLTFMLAPTLYGVGVALSFTAHKAWPAVPEWPVWLPIAYERAPFGWDYLGFLVVLPLMLVALPAWFLYEVTVANLTSVTDDRSTGVRIWYLVSTGLCTVGAAAVALSTPTDRATVAALLLSLMFWYLLFNATVFAGEPIGPSRRVTARWDAEGRSLLARALGPGVMPAALILLATGVLSLAAVTGAAIAGISVFSLAATKPAEIVSVVTVGGYAAGFFVFMAGFSAWMRARTNSSATARVLLAVALFFILMGPWIVAAIGGIFTSRSDASMIMAAPSPIYALVIADKITSSPLTGHQHEVTACFVTACVWALLGVLLLGRAGVICRRVIVAHEHALAAGDALLAAEDAAREEAVTDVPREEAAVGESRPP